MKWCWMVLRVFWDGFGMFWDGFWLVWGWFWNVVVDGFERGPLECVLIPGAPWLSRLGSKSPWRLERGQLRELFGLRVLFVVCFAVFGMALGLSLHGFGWV